MGMAVITELKERIDEALEIAYSYGGIEGDHHKTWVIDQMIRKLTGDYYEQWVRDFEHGEDGPQTYKWEQGIPP